MLAVLLAAALAAGCGGPATVLHDILDEAETRVELILESFDDTEEEMTEAIATELPPCPAVYEPPPLAQQPPYASVVERPADLQKAAQDNEVVSTYEAICEIADASLETIPGIRDRLRPQLEDFSDYADTMRSFIDDDMEDDDIETLSAEESIPALDLDDAPGEPRPVRVRQPLPGVEGPLPPVDGRRRDRSRSAVLSRAEHAQEEAGRENAPTPLSCGLPLLGRHHGLVSLIRAPPLRVARVLAICIDRRAWEMLPRLSNQSQWIRVTCQPLLEKCSECMKRCSRPACDSAQVC